MKRAGIPLLVLLLFTGAASSERQRAAHALNRLAFGPRPGDVERVAAMGTSRWIEQQLHPESIPDRAVETRLVRFETLRMSDAQILETFYVPLVEARRAAKKDGAANGEDKGEDKGEDAREMRRRIPREQRPQRVVGELMGQRVLRAAESERQLHEVMVDFWFNHFNVFSGKGIDRFLLTSYERDGIRPHVWGKFEDLLMATAKSPAMLFYLDNARSRSGAINENYARELMELHTLGVDGGYTQKDVTELARVLTGWSLTRPRQEQGMAFVFRKGMHDGGAKSVLGVRFAPGGGIDEGERMIRFLARHPATAHRIALKLCQRLVADEPPKALVDRVAQRFLDTGGDLRGTVRAVVTSREFFDSASIRSKVKSPFEFAISAVRAAGATIANPMPLARELQKLGEPLYGAQPPTGYSDKAEAWINSGALMARMNFALALASNTIPGIEVDPARLAAVAEGTELSAATRKAIEKRGNDRAAVAGLILGSPEFQRQ